MSELQKWITSITGAVVGQIAVLAFFYLLVSNPISPSLSAKSATPEQREVTVMLSQLVDQALQELPEPEPKPEEAEENQPEQPLEEIPVNKRQFVNTDSNTARTEAPENTLFESDRNTTASTEFLPDPNQPQQLGPTLRGEEVIKSLSLANQNYVDGEIKPDPTPAPAMSQPPPPQENPVPETEPVEQMKDTPPGEVEQATETEQPTDELSEGEAEEAKPGEADTPPDRESELVTQPETETVEDEAQMATAVESFVDPGDAANVMNGPSLNDETDQEAIAEKLTEEFDEPLAPEEKKELKAEQVVVGESMDKIKEQHQQAVDADTQKQLDESMFNPAFLAHRRKNNQNGDITTIGEGSVDAMATATGEYKKAIEQAIGRKWHQYRQDRAADVTWGFLRVKFFVTPNGYIRNLRIEKKEATELVTEFSLRAIVDAQIPPMPPEVAIQYGPKGIEMNYNIQIY